MSGWAPAAPAYDPSTGVPAAMQVASMGRRIGAWILDFIFATLFAIVPLILAFVIGAVTVDQQAADLYNQYASDPWANVNVPLLGVNMGLLWIAAIVYLAFMALYFTGAWIAWGSTVGQKMLGLRVADKSSGQKLSLEQALLRWAVVAGAAQAVFAVFMVRLFDWMSRIPANELFAKSGYGSSVEMDSGVAALSVLALWGTLLWMGVLLIVTAVDGSKRGWHDKIAGSVVLGPLQYAAYSPYAAYPGAPVYPPQAPGYPPQAPQAPGYPPSAYPGYPPAAYPGYPPQAQPPQPQPPAQPPAQPAPAGEPPAAKPKRTPKPKS